MKGPSTDLRPMENTRDIGHHQIRLQSTANVTVHSVLHVQAISPDPQALDFDKHAAAAAQQPAEAAQQPAGAAHQPAAAAQQIELKLSGLSPSLNRSFVQRA